LQRDDVFSTILKGSRGLVCGDRRQIMGLIFDRQIATYYDSWFQSPQGRAIDRSIEHLILALLNPRPGERILDIGCGTGNHLLMLNKLGLDVSGIDASPLMIDKARERLGHRCGLETGMAEDLPFDDNQFDLAVLINTLEFLDDPLQALREAGRVAHRKVFIGVINSLSWNGLIKRIQGYLGDPLFGQARFYNIWQLKSLLLAGYGRVPISWGCIRIRPLFIEGMSPLTKNVCNWEHSPFGSFLGLSATMLCRIKTDNLPLKIRLKKAGQSLIGAKTLEDLNRSKGAQGDERGLPV
jgi:ubiquinone/menaquinone biosynthesis C-methylase UbiE